MSAGPIKPALYVCRLWGAVCRERRGTEQDEASHGAVYILTLGALFSHTHCYASVRWARWARWAHGCTTVVGGITQSINQSRLTGELPSMTPRVLTGSQIMGHLTSAHLSPSGNRVIVTARGQVAIIGRDGKRVSPPCPVVALHPTNPTNTTQFPLTVTDAVPSLETGAESKLEHSTGKTSLCGEAYTPARRAPSSTTDLQRIYNDYTPARRAPSSAYTPRCTDGRFASEVAVFFQSDAWGGLQQGLRVHHCALGPGGMCTAGALAEAAATEPHLECRFECIPSPDGRWVAYHTRTEVR